MIHIVKSGLDILLHDIVPIYVPILVTAVVTAWSTLWLSNRNEKEDIDNKYKFIMTIILADIHTAIEFYTNKTASIGIMPLTGLEYEISDFGRVFRENAIYITYKSETLLVKQILDFYNTLPGVIYALQKSMGNAAQKKNDALNSAQKLQKEISKILTEF